MHKVSIFFALHTVDVHDEHVLSEHTAARARASCMLIGRPEEAPTTYLGQEALKAAALAELAVGIGANACASASMWHVLGDVDGRSRDGRPS